jgi:hypothetical protein
MDWIGICAMAFILTGVLPCQDQRKRYARTEGYWLEPRRSGARSATWLLAVV